jgi:hypothetical protein
VTDIVHIEISGEDGEDDLLIQIGDGPVQPARGPITIGRRAPSEPSSFAVICEPAVQDASARIITIGGVRHRLLSADEVPEFIRRHGVPTAWRFPKG